MSYMSDRQGKDANGQTADPVQKRDLHPSRAACAPGWRPRIRDACRRRNKEKPPSLSVPELQRTSPLAEDQGWITCCCRPTISSHRLHKYLFFLPPHATEWYTIYQLIH